MILRQPTSLSAASDKLGEKNGRAFEHLHKHEGEKREQREFHTEMSCFIYQGSDVTLYMSGTLMTLIINKSKEKS